MILYLVLCYLFMIGFQIHTFWMYLKEDYHQEGFGFARFCKFLAINFFYAIVGESCQWILEDLYSLESAYQAAKFLIGLP